MYQPRPKPAFENHLSGNDALRARIEADADAILTGPMQRRNAGAITRMAVTDAIERVVLRELARVQKREGAKV